MTDKLFTVVGTSNLNGTTKVRWANDLVTRFKMLHKGGHLNIELFELPEAMTKQQACEWLVEQEAFESKLTQEARYAVQAKLDEYSKSKKEVKISLDEIKTRPTIDGWDVVNKEDTTVDQYIKEHQ